MMKGPLPSNPTVGILGGAAIKEYLNKILIFLNILLSEVFSQTVQSLPVLL